MSGANPNIPIAQRYEKLVDLWEQFAKEPEARLCRWLIEPDELQMISLFYDTESSARGRTPDIFFKLTTPFLQASSYGPQVIEELDEQISNYLEANPDQGIQLRWKPTTPSDALDSAQYFLQNFHALATELEVAARAVAYLSPADISSFGSWEKWLSQVIEAEVPALILLMLTDVIDGKEGHLQKIATQYPQQVKTLQPQLDMTAAMKEVAAAGDPQHPGVQFQMLFLDLSQAAGQGNMKQVEPLAHQCLTMARQQGWPHLQVAVFFVLVSAWMGKKNYQKVLQTYDQACTVAKNMYETQQMCGHPLYIQTLLARASALIAPKTEICDFEAAYHDYEHAAQVASKLPEEDPARSYHLMEAWRMMGHCKEQLKDYRMAQSCYQQSLHFGQAMKPAERGSSTLPYAGAALLRINARIGKKEEALAIHQQMVALAGEDWEAKVITKKGKAP